MEDLEFRQLEILCEVVRLGSFSRAAKKVHLSQASVSERIAGLEEDVGCALFERSPGRGVRPTRVGQALYQRAVRMLRDRELAVQELRDLLGVRRGKLRIGASTVPGTYHLPSVLRRFSSRYPDAHFSLSITGSQQVVEGVSSGDFDLGISGEPDVPASAQVSTGKGHASVTHTRLWRDSLVLAVPSGHPLTRKERIRAAELANVPFVLRESGSGTRRWTDLFLEHELPRGLKDLHVIAEVNNLCAVKQSVVHGLGVSIVSARAIQAELKSGLLEIVDFERPITRWFYLVHDERRAASSISRLFIQVLLDSSASPNPE